MALRLDNLPSELFQQAFDKVYKETSVARGELVRITEDHYKQALRFIDEQYIRHEPLTRALGVHWNEELEDYYLGVLKLNLSLMIIDRSSGTIMAIRVTRIARSNAPTDLSTIKDDAFRNLTQYSIFCDDKADFFGHYDTNEAFHFIALAVDEQFKRQGVGTAIFKAAVNLIKYLGLPSAYIKGEASSNYSRKIYKKFGFDELFDQPYETYKVDGKVVIPDAGEHKTMTVHGLKIV